MALVELTRIAGFTSAELLRSRLVSEGVHAVCFDTGISEGLDLMMPIRVMVLEEDLEEAHALMAAFGAA